MTEEIKANWRVDRNRGLPGYPFAVLAPYNDGLPGEAVLGAFAYKPHADLAAAAPRLLAALRLALRNADARLYQAAPLGASYGQAERATLQAERDAYAQAIEAATGEIPESRYD